MGVIKGVLKEELGNSLRMVKRYQEEADKIKGCLVRKKIGKKYYYYLARREGKKVRFIYRGLASGEVKRVYLEQKKRLNHYKELLSRVKKQVKFLRKVLRGKESV